MPFVPFVVPSANTMRGGGANNGGRGASTTMAGLRVAMLAATLMLLVLMGVSVSNTGAAMGRRVAARRFLAGEGITGYNLTSQHV